MALDEMSFQLTFLLAFMIGVIGCRNNRLSLRHTSEPAQLRP